MERFWSGFCSWCARWHYITLAWTVKKSEVRFPTEAKKKKITQILTGFCCFSTALKTVTVEIEAEYETFRSFEDIWDIWDGEGARRIIQDIWWGEGYTERIAYPVMLMTRRCLIKYIISQNRITYCRGAEKESLQYTQQSQVRSPAGWTGANSASWLICISSDFKR